MMSKAPLSKFCKLARRLGARQAQVISTETIVTSPWVRLKCQYGCAGYGETLTCPPYSPPSEEMEKVVKSFRKAILVQGDEHSPISEIVVKLEREAFLAGYYKHELRIIFRCQKCNPFNYKEL